VDFWDFLVWFFWLYILVSCIWIFITVIIDVFRDHTLNGGAKALWVIFLVFVPFLAAFIYLLARGRSMAERRVERRIDAAGGMEAYTRVTAGPPSVASEIESAKRLLDAGVITSEEYGALKANALRASA
jgi:hypothetical protein